MENNSNHNSSNQNRSWEDNSHSNQGYDSTNRQQVNQNQNQGGQNWSSQPYLSKLPADNGAMVLAIISTVLFAICCCFGGQYVALVLSVIGFFIAQSSIKKYQENPGIYDPNSLRRVNNAKIYNLVVAIVCLIVTVLSFLTIFANIFDKYNYLDMLDQNEEWQDEDVYYQDAEQEDNWYEYEEEVDSLKKANDTIFIEEVPEIEEIPQD